MPTDACGRPLLKGVPATDGVADTPGHAINTGQPEAGRGHVQIMYGHNKCAYPT
jgi:hypothetical protein